MTFRVFEWQAVAVARVLAGRAQLPSREERTKWEEDKVERDGDRLEFFDIGVNFEEYFEELRMLTGEPMPGSSARSLLKFEWPWEQEVSLVIEARKRWWGNERIIAEGDIGAA